MDMAPISLTAQSAEFYVLACLQAVLFARAGYRPYLSVVIYAIIKCLWHIKSKPFFFFIS